MNIKLLDCTLRDGGYVNNWEFGEEHIRSVIIGLTSANIDIIECGFIQDKPHSDEQSLFNSIDEVLSVLPTEHKTSQYVVMMNSGEYDVSQLLSDDANKIFGIRIVFHAHQAEQTLTECKALKDKGYRVFLQPMGTDAYSDKSLIELIEKVNEIEPYAFYFVDSLGVMTSEDVVRIALLIHNSLNPGIVMGFHSHNNLQLSFSNVQKLINMRLKRELIVDSSVFGMGRGAGNLHSELLANYLNTAFDADYGVDWILRVYDESIRNLREQFTWGYSVPHYLAAVYKCHQNYGSYLMKRATLPITDISVLLSRIPDESKRQYSEKLIDDLYVEYISNKVDDSEDLSKLKTELFGRKLLLLAPGKTLKTHKAEIDSFIQRQQPMIISINNKLNLYNTDYIFFSNRKRYEMLKTISSKLILTSNVTTSANNAYIIDYTTLCNQHGKYSDNAALMLLSLLVRLGCKAVSFAGLDGFTGDGDYYNEILHQDLDDDWIQSMNEAISKEIKQYRKLITIDFVTPTLYFGG
jgi:4-hydroxy 2-oxovalerate aldolase